MATAIRASGVTSLLEGSYAWPRCDSVEKTVRKARRALSNARHVTDDVAKDASREVRRHPLTAVGVSTAAGLVTGCFFGIAAGWYFSRRA